MSKEKPEVGDVWFINWSRCYIIQTNLIADKIRVLIKNDKDSYIVRDYLPSAVQSAFYLGKSKVSIKELFDVKD